MKFYLGTHMPHWLRDSDVPLFVSHRRLARNKSVPRAVCSWALDSGGFTELAKFGGWATGPHEYATAVRRYRDEVGMMEWAAPQDWMCEPGMIEKTGLSVRAHQALTLRNFVQLRQIAPDLPFIPVLQGWTLDDYLDHVDAYGAAGFDLTTFDLVGVGSVCRRQDTDEIRDIIAALNDVGVRRIHGFGVKGDGFGKYGHQLASADSMAWSKRGFHIMPCPHTGAKSCANCRVHALEWRRRTLARVVGSPA